MVAGNGNAKVRGSTAAVVVGIIAIIATLITAIPSFLELTRDRPDVFYAYEPISLIYEEAENYEELSRILAEKGIPDKLLSIKVQNIGSGPASEVKIGVSVGGPIGRIETRPRSAKLGSWVTLETDLDSLTGEKDAVIELKGLATTKLLELTVSYTGDLEKEADNESSVEVFYNGKPATLVSDMQALVKRSSSGFLLPLGILICGSLLALLLAALNSLQKRWKSEGSDSGPPPFSVIFSEVVKATYPFMRLFLP